MRTRPATRRHPVRRPVWPKWRRRGMARCTRDRWRRSDPCRRHAVHGPGRQVPGHCAPGPRASRRPAPRHRAPGDQAPDRRVGGRLVRFRLVPRLSMGVLHGGVRRFPPRRTPIAPEGLKTARPSPATRPPAKRQGKTNVAGQALERLVFASPRRGARRLGHWLWHTVVRRGGSPFAGPGWPRRRGNARRLQCRSFGPLASCFILRAGAGRARMGLFHRRLNRMGTDRITGLPGSSGGGAGRGDIRAASAKASASSDATPEPRSRLADNTAPARLREIRT